MADPDGIRTRHKLTQSRREPADGVEAPPVVVNHLFFVGDERAGHRFELSVEEPIAGHTAVIRGDVVRTCWLRARCSCGWAAGHDERTALEENSHWRWLNHAHDAIAAAQDGDSDG